MPLRASEMGHTSAVSCGAFGQRGQELAGVHSTREGGGSGPGHKPAEADTGAPSYPAGLSFIAGFIVYHYWGLYGRGLRLEAIVAGHGGGRGVTLP